jgi:hypothetical protein
VFLAPLPIHPPLATFNLATSSGKETPHGALREYARPSGGRERHEQIKLHGLSKVIANRLTLVLSILSLKGVGMALGFR